METIECVKVITEDKETLIYQEGDTDFGNPDINVIKQLKDTYIGGYIKIEDKMYELIDSYIDYDRAGGYYFVNHIYEVKQIKTENQCI